MRALRRVQDEILQGQRQVLALLGARPAPSAGGEAPDAPAAGAPPRIRQRRKSVLLVDDDPETSAAAAAALRKAEVPVRAVSDGRAAIDAISDEKPDVLVLELDIGDPMPGKDLINVVKATMEWVDIPVVLYTRQPIDPGEVRTTHGADDLAPKGPDGAATLVSRVIALFQRG